MHPKVSGVLCLQKVRQTAVAQSYKQLRPRLADNQTHLKAAGEGLLLPRVTTRPASAGGSHRSCTLAPQRALRMRSRTKGRGRICHWQSPPAIPTKYK